jgi:GTP pyrophosphokinase
MDIDQVSDIVALRVIVKNVEDCYRVLGVIHGMWRPLPGRIKDYIAVPKPNGYRSLHTTIFTGDGGIAEIQIRTVEMENIAQYGIASHHIYKTKGNSHRKGTRQQSFDWLDQLRDFQKEDLHPTDFMKELRTDFFQDRIFAFTPAGDVIDLPQGSTVVDFAYAIHSDLGNHMSAVKINGKRASISKELQSRDIVEVESKTSAKPSQKWISYAQTNLAKRHIKNYLRKKNKNLVEKVAKK